MASYFFWFRSQFGGYSMHSHEEEGRYRPLQPYGLTTFPRGVALLTDPFLNKGTAYTPRERSALGLEGLLPHRVFDLEEQARRALGQFHRKSNNLEKYVFLIALQQRNETLFYKVLLDNLEEMMPVIYTPTVGQACLEYGSIFRRPRGLWITLEHRGRIAEVLRHWPFDDVRIIVVTDGERILGLGDLGALGMGIPIGKLALYSACAGLHPTYCLPITLDVGTNNQLLLGDPMYIGMSRERAHGEEYDSFLSEFVEAVANVFPRALLQFEDFGNHNAFALLERYQNAFCCFNDDIQGTAAVGLAGLIAALRITQGSLADQRILLAGAGEAGMGIADLCVTALEEEGIPAPDGRKRCWFVDSKGLVTKDRSDFLTPNKLRYAHEARPAPTLLEAVRQVRPTALIGVSGTGGLFTEEVLAATGQFCERPIIFALSNPTSKAECTPNAAYAATEGRAIYASGSPFPPVEQGGKHFVPGQGNNVYIFPGVGLGVLAFGSSRVTNRMFLRAARCLAAATLPEDLELGRIYPALTRIRPVSAAIAEAVAAEAFAAGLAAEPEPPDIGKAVRARMFEPQYRPYA